MQFPGVLFLYARLVFCHHPVGWNCYWMDDVSNLIPRIDATSSPCLPPDGART
jgi:hypothetical protein